MFTCSVSNNDCLTKFIDLIPEPVVVIDNQEKIVDVNHSVWKLSGYIKEQLVGKRIFDLDFICDEYRQLLAKNVENRIAGCNIEAYIVAITTKKGQLKYLEVKGNRFEHNGQLLDFVIFHDVTQEKNVQADKKAHIQLLCSEEKFRSIAEAGRDAIILVDEKGKITYWNPAAERIFGYTNKEAIGKNVHNLVVPKTMCKEGKERIKTSLDIFAETGTGYFTVGNVQLVGLRKDNKEFPAELSISPIKFDEKWNAVGVVKDITERKKAEEMLREAEQRYHALFNQAPIGVLIVDPETTAFVEFNDFTHRQLGYSREQFENLTILDIEAKEAKTETCLRWGKMAIVGGEDFETQHRTKDGNIKNMLVSTRPINLAGKTFLHCIFHDITEIRTVQKFLVESESRYRNLAEHLEDLVKQRTKELAETQAQLIKSERLAAIGELAGMVGHDLRNPLTGIKNAAYFLKRKNAFPTPQSRDMLEIIDRCVDHSNKIINDLLDYSKEIRLMKEKTSPRRLIVDALAMISLPEEVQVVNNLTDELIADVDIDKMTRVFINFIKNASDAMPNGGQIRIDSMQVDNHLEISLADSGIGIPDEVLPKLFSPLLTTKAQGMGFGLAICKRIVEAHGGTIAVKTAKGIGTTFTVTLPIEPKVKMGGEQFE